MYNRRDKKIDLVEASLHPRRRTLGIVLPPPPPPPPPSRKAAAETVEHAAARMSLYLGRLKVLKSGLGRKAGGKYLAMGRCGLVSCWAEVEKRFGFTALEAYADSIRAYRSAHDPWLLSDV